MCFFNMRDKWTWNAGIKNSFLFILHSTNIGKNLLLFSRRPETFCYEPFLLLSKKGYESTKFIFVLEPVHTTNIISAHVHVHMQDHSCVLLKTG